MKFLAAVALLWSATAACVPVYGAELLASEDGPYAARVERVLVRETRPLGWRDGESDYAKIEVRLLEGPRSGELLYVETDYPGIEEGVRITLNRIVDAGGGVERFAVVSLERTNRVYMVIAAFALVVVAFGGKQGLRSLMSLAGSFLAIFYVLMPGLLSGWNPLFASFLVAATVLCVAIFVTHGVTRESVCAYGGTMLAVSVTAILALWAVDFTYLTGFSGDEATYLDMATAGTIDFRGLLLGAIVIGILGVLDDIAVTQAAVVSELYATSPSMTRAEAYRRAMRVGKDHVAALVNTLVLAYAGTALPLMLLFTSYGRGVSDALNREVFATEVVRAAVGSVGLILTVPVVTAISVAYLRGRGRSGISSGCAHAHGHHRGSHAHH